MMIARVPPIALVLAAFVLAQGAAPLMTTPLAAQASSGSWSPGDSLSPGQDYRLTTESLRRWARTTRALAKALPNYTAGGVISFDSARADSISRPEGYGFASDDTTALGIAVKEDLREWKNTRALVMRLIASGTMPHAEYLQFQEALKVAELAMMTTERLDGLAAYFGSAGAGSAKITNGLPPVVLANVAFRRRHAKEFRAMNDDRDAVWGVRPSSWKDLPVPPPR